MSKLEDLLSEQRELKKLLASGGTLEPKSVGFATEVGDVEISASQAKSILAQSAHLLSVAPLSVPERVTGLKQEIETLHNRLEQRASAGPISAESLLEQAEKVGDATILVAEASYRRSQPDASAHRPNSPKVRQQRGSPRQLRGRRQSHARRGRLERSAGQRGPMRGNWVRPVAQVLGGGGGGRPDMAQAGGKQPAKLPEALEVARQTISEMIGS